MNISPAQPTPAKLEDFPDADIVGGAVILNGKNMGTLVAGGTVELSTQGELFLANAAQTSPPVVQKIDEVPDPVPSGVIDPSKMAPVTAVAKAAVRKRKQNTAVVDAMNSPTDEEEADFKEADKAPAGGPEQPPNMGVGDPEANKATGASPAAPRAPAPAPVAPVGPAPTY